MNILTSRPSEQRAVLVDHTTANDYAVPIPINPLFKNAFMAVGQQSHALKGLNVQVVHEMSPSEAEKRSQLDVGVFTAKFNGWTCTLNWTQEKRGKLPPDYIGVDYGNVSCGIIGPYLTIRTCWHCGMTGWRDAKKRVGCVQSSRFHEGLWLSMSCPNCHQTDWWANTIEPSRFHRDCAVAVGEGTGRKKLVDSFGGSTMDSLIQNEGKGVA